MTEPKEDGFVASAHSTSGATKYVQSIRLGHHTISADEPEVLGGQDKGPAPFALLLGSLAACTAITLEMYAGRKNWDLGTVKIDLRMFRGADGAERVERRIAIEKPLTDDQRTRLVEIAGKTPVTKTLLRSMAIDTTLR